MLEDMRSIWDGDERGYAGAVGPVSHGAPQLIVGGSVEAAFKRVARFGDGWIMGGGAPDMIVASAATDAETVRQYVSGFEKSGCDELIFCPASGDPNQAGLLAEALEG